MPFPSRKKHRSWEITPAHLPTEEVLATEPRLRGLENNPVFRLTMLRRRAPLFESLLPLIYIFGIFHVFTLIDGGLLVLAGILFWAVVVFLLHRWVQPPGGAASLWGLTREHYADLYLTSLPPHEIVAGLWGNSLSRRSMREETRALRLLTLLFILGAVSLPAPLNVACHVCIFLTVFGLAAVHRAHPFHALPALARAVAAQRRAIEGRAQSAEVLFHTLLAVGRLFLMVLVIYAILFLVLAVIMLNFTLVSLFFPFSEIDPDTVKWNLQQVLIFPLNFLGTLAAGWATGRIVGDSRITRSRMLLERITDEIETILMMQQER